MNYIINPAWFYWLQLVSSIKAVLVIFLIVSALLFVVFFAVFITNVDCCGMDDKDTQKYAKLVKRCAIACVVFSVLVVIVPSKDTMIEMQIARYATYDNAAWTLDAVKSAVDYIVEAIKEIK